MTHAKYIIRAPAVATVVQTQFIWPGELAQPGTPIVAVLDPTDKYVQVYVPVADVAEFRVGRRSRSSSTARPGSATPGEVSFVADQANFTPEKIETRSDRLGQVYRAKVRILEDVERFQPGTEGQRLPRGGGATRVSEPVVRLRGLVKRFGARRALAGIDLTLEGAQIVGVVGPDGAGKTTLIRTLAGLLEVEADRDAGARLRSPRRRDGAEGTHRLRAADLQPAARADRRGEPALHRASAPAAGCHVRGSAPGPPRAHRAGAVRRPARRRALRRDEAEARDRQRAPAAARAAAARRADRRRRRRRARRDLGAARGRAQRGARRDQHQLPRRGGGLRSPRLPRRRPRRRQPARRRSSAPPSRSSCTAPGATTRARIARAARGRCRTSHGARATGRYRARRGAARTGPRARRPCCATSAAAAVAGVRFAEQLPVDMESTLLALAHGLVAA